jgi:L-cysteine S-thiosulfotransferase
VPAGLLVLCLLLVALPARAQTPPTTVTIVTDTIPTPLSPTPADAARGRAIVLDRANGNCLICHQVPEPSESFQGDLGPTLKGIGARLTPAQMRLRLVDQSRLNPATLMPPFYRTEGLTRVAPKFAGLPVLKAGEIEDVIAYLFTLKD